MRPSLTPRNRRILAALAALLWLLGVEVLPNVHLATHRDDHTHAHDGAIVRAPAHDEEHHDEHEHEHEHVDEHEHSDHAHEAAVEVAHHDEDAHHDHTRGVLAVDVAPSGHEAAGLAHHALALHEPPPLLTTPVAEPRVWVWLHPAPIERLTSIGYARPTARGPPVRG